MFYKQIMHRDITLATSSKSRIKILRNAGLKFKQTKPFCDEEEIKKQILNLKNKPTYYVKRLSYEKAKSVSILKKYKNDLVIGCDTIVVLNNKVFDKAKNFDQARDKIKKLSGKQHFIITGVTIFLDQKKIWSCSQKTKVVFRKLSDQQIKNYLKITGSQILSSVGCYQIEALGPIIIEDIKGDFFNVMGMPLFKLLKYLSNKK